MHVKMDKGLKSDSLGLCQSNTNKPMMGLTYGRPWKLCKEPGFQSLRFLSDSQYLQQGASVGALKANVLVWESLLHEMSSRADKYDGGTSRHTSICMGTRWPIGQRWRGCAPTMWSRKRPRL